MLRRSERGQRVPPPAGGATFEPAEARADALAASRGDLRGRALLAPASEAYDGSTLDERSPRDRRVRAPAGRLSRQRLPTPGTSAISGLPSLRLPST